MRRKRWLLHEFDLETLRGLCETNEDGCWLWPNGTTTFGYGYQWIEGRQVLLHRHAATLAHGEPDGRYALHKCREKACCNPEHLYWGNQSDNMKDLQRDGKAPDRRWYGGMSHREMVETFGPLVDGPWEDFVSAAEEHGFGPYRLKAIMLSKLQ